LNYVLKMYVVKDKARYSKSANRISNTNHVHQVTSSSFSSSNSRCYFTETFRSLVIRYKDETWVKHVVANPSHS